MKKNPVLYILIGAPGSGKSTWATSLGVPVVSRDKIRFSLLNNNDKYFSKETEVFSIFIKKIGECLLSGKSVIADASHLTKGGRKKLIDRLHYVENFDIIFVHFKTSLENCLKFNKQRTGLALVPSDVLTNMYNSMETPCINEFPNVKKIIEIENK